MGFGGGGGEPLRLPSIYDFQPGPTRILKQEPDPSRNCKECAHWDERRHLQALGTLRHVAEGLASGVQFGYVLGTT